MYLSHFLYDINISNYLQAIITIYSSMDKMKIWQLSSVILLFVPLDVLLQVDSPKIHFVSVQKESLAHLQQKTLQITNSIKLQTVSRHKSLFYNL